MKTIYNTYVVMESQEQCDRMKKLCIDNDLPICNNYNGFEFGAFKYLYYAVEMFVVWVSEPPLNQTQVTEQEFIELLNKKL